MKDINLIVRLVATLAIWSIALVMSLRLEHPLIAITLGAVASGLTFLIWTQKSDPGRRD